jgi:hypothetical protein
MKTSSGLNITPSLQSGTRPRFFRKKDMTPDIALLGIAQDPGTVKGARFGPRGHGAF